MYGFSCHDGVLDNNWFVQHLSLDPNSAKSNPSQKGLILCSSSNWDAQKRASSGSSLLLYLLTVCNAAGNLYAKTTVATLLVPHHVYVVRRDLQLSINLALASRAGIPLEDLLGCLVPGAQQCRYACSTHSRQKVVHHLCWDRDSRDIHVDSRY